MKFGKGGAWIGGTAIGLGVVACLLCAALPLLAVVGLSAGAVGWLTSSLELTGVTLIVLGSIAGGTVLWRRYAGSASDPVDALASGCGCPGEADTVSERSTLAPVPGDCSLKRDEVVPRIAAFEAVFTNGFIASERAAEGVRWRFANSAQRLEELRALADEERGCCGFFRFNVYRHGSEIRWDTVAAPEHRAALELWHQLPERVRAAG